MRSEDEMMKLILDIAMKDERIRLVTLEGSRTNKNVPRDKFQDYDISYFVTDMDSFTSDESWLDQFGERMMMQKPEDMELFLRNSETGSPISCFLKIIIKST